MQIDLIIRKESEPGPYTITCDLAERLVFGRSIGSPVNFAGSDISREHFALQARNGQVWVQDLSSNGTFINGEPVAQRKPKKLSEGDVITVPGYEIELGRRLPIISAPKPQQSTIPPQIGKAASRWSGSFTPWEIIVIAAAIASFILIVYYLTS
ncbi:MAG TPA: FHA domain-containing protein [Bryobacteraceae bacterium]|nr:FHA domain-containing protein [Bryobacteraceae bacterium]